MTSVNVKDPTPPEVGPIPVDWEVRKINEIGEVVTGTTPKTAMPDFWDGAIPFVSPSDMDGAKYVTHTERYVTEKGAAVGRIIPKESLMVTCIASIGKLAISKEECITNQQINTIIPKENYDTTFLYYTLLQKENFLSTLAAKTAVPIINKKTFSNIHLQIPAFHEQREIAAILSSVDEAIDKTKEIVVQTEEVKSGLMQELLTKGIAHTEFKKTEIGNIPLSWEVIALGTIAERITKGTTPSTYGFSYENKGINFIKVENISKQGKVRKDHLMKISPEAHGKLSRSIMQEGDILVTIAGALGRTALVTADLLPANTNQAVSIVRIKGQDYFNDFILYALKGYVIKKYISMVSTVGAQPNLSLKQVGDFKVAFPPLEEQKEIVSILRSVDEKLMQEEQKINELYALKKGLMQNLLSGKVRVEESI